MENMVALRREDILETAKQVLEYFVNNRKEKIEHAIIETKRNIWLYRQQKADTFFQKLKNIWCILKSKPIPIIYKYPNEVPDDFAIEVLKYSDGWDWSEWTTLQHKCKTELTVEMIVGSSEPMNQVYYIEADIFVKILKIQKEISNKTQYHLNLIKQPKTSVFNERK